MRMASLAAAAICLLLSLAAIGFMLRDDAFEAQGPEAWAVSALPILFATLGVRFAVANRRLGLWVVAGLFVLYIIIGAFSVGPYFWYATGAAVVSALLLQFADRDGR